MANEVSRAAKAALKAVLEEAPDASDVAKSVTKNVSKSDGPLSKDGALSGGRGVVAGAALAAAVPLAGKGALALAKRQIRKKMPGVSSPKDLAQEIGDRTGGQLKDKVGEKVDEAGGAGGIAKEAVGGGGGGLGSLFGGGDDDGGSGSADGTGENRRMPIQQAVDVAAPLETVYNQFTQFEDWPDFMFRTSRVTQEDDCTVAFTVRLWGITRDFTAKIVEQYPDERILWEVESGIDHTGVVTFHELSDRLTRVQVLVDIDPSGLVEKFGRGARFTKRALRSELHRFQAYVEMNGQETGAWRGTIEDGELVEEHDDSYDEERDFADEEDLGPRAPSSNNGDGADDPEASQDEDEGDGEGEEDAEDDAERQQRSRQDQRRRTERFQRQASRTGSGNGSGSGGRRRSGPSSPRPPRQPRQPAT